MRRSRGFKGFMGDESGQNLVEYSLVFILVMLGAAASLHSIGLWFSTMGTWLASLSQYLR